MSNAKLAAQRTWTRWCLLVWATVVVCATFRAGVIRPPGWRHKFPSSYDWFVTFNSMAFFISVIMLVLLSTDRLLRASAMRATMLPIALFHFGMAFFVAAFVCGSFPEYPLGALLARIVACVLVLSLAFMAR